MPEPVTPPPAPEPPPTGRPPKLPAVRALILKTFRHGFTVKEACDAVEVHQSNFYRWLASNATFREQVQAARAEGRENYKLRLEERVTRAAHDDVVIRKTHIKRVEGKVVMDEVTEERRGADPRNAQWLLERRWPREYGRKDTVSLDGAKVATLDFSEGGVIGGGADDAEGADGAEPEQ